MEHCSLPPCCYHTLLRSFSARRLVSRLPPPSSLVSPCGSSRCSSARSSNGTSTSNSTVVSARSSTSGGLRWSSSLSSIVAAAKTSSSSSPLSFSTRAALPWQTLRPAVSPILLRRWASGDAARDVDDTAAAAAAAAVEAAEAAVEETAALDSEAAGFATATAQGSDQIPARLPSERTVYVGNLFFDVSADMLRREFERFGDLTEARVTTDRRGLSKGFGFVTFTRKEAAEAAMNRLDGQVFHGRRMSVQPARRGQTVSNYAQARPPADREVPKEPTQTLYVGNMPFEVTDKDLNDLFKPLKGVVDVRVAVDRRTGRPRGFAHVDFSDIPSSVAARQHISGQSIHGRTLRVDYTQNSAYLRLNRASTGTGDEGGRAKSGQQQEQLLQDEEGGKEQH